MLDRLLADLNSAVVSRQEARVGTLRKALAACRMRAMTLGLPPNRPLPEVELLGILRELMAGWEEEARHCDRQGEGAEGQARRAEMAVLEPYLWSLQGAKGDEAEDPALYHLRRHAHRLNVGTGFSLRFFIMGEAFEDIRVTNLGAGGCRVELNPELAELLQKGTRLHNLAFCHPELPDTPVLAEVVYLLGKQSLLKGTSGQGRKVMAGLKFIHPAPEFEEALADYVEARCRAEDNRLPAHWQERFPRLETAAVPAPRLKVGAGFTACFFLLDETFPDVPLLNLSAGGCCLLLHRELAELLRAGTRLHNFALCHPDLPADPQHAEVVYVREEGLEEGSLRVTAGLKFLHPKPEFQGRIAAYVRERLRGQAQGD